MTPEEAYEEALRRIREAEETGAVKLDLSGLGTLNRLPPELECLTSLQELDLRSCWVLTDLSPLTGLTFLRALYLTGCAQLSDLSPLAGLTSLRALKLSYYGQLCPLAGLTSLQKLNLYNCGQLTDLSPLAGLTSLQKLDFSHCLQLSDLRPLAGLTSLQKLNLGECEQLSDLRPVARLTSLQTFNFTGCKQLSDLGPLAGLTSLRILNLHGCEQLRRFAPLESLLPTLQQLYLFGCKLDDLPSEVLGRYELHDVLDKVRAHYEDLKAGQQIDAEVKVLFLGNGGTGKTQLCRRLRDLPFDPNIPTTHGVQLGQTSVKLDGFQELVRLNLWDFGGQDIYHGSHALFLQGPAIFLILWTPELESGSDSEGDLTLQRRPLSYWLDYVRNFAGKDASLLIVQSQCDTRDQRVLDPPAIVKDFPFHRHTEVSARTGLNLGILKEYIKEAVRDRFDRRPPPSIGAGRLKVRDWLREMLEQDQKREPAERQHRLLERPEFDRLCDEVGGVSDKDALLDFLHHNGVVFYRRGLFNNRIILDQNWALEAIYTLFDREKVFPFLHDDGRFTRTKLERLIWSNYTTEEQEIFLEMMESCGICFRVRELPSKEQLAWGDKEWEYVAPELLPEWSDAQKVLLTGRIPKGQAMEQADANYAFLHEGVLQGYLSKLGEQAKDSAIYWKYGCWFYEETTDSRVLIEGLWDDAESEAGAGTIRFRAWGERACQLIDPLLVELQRLPIGQPPKIVWQGGEVDVASRNGLNKMKITESPQSLATPPQVFVSFAFGDTSSAFEVECQRQEVVEKLCQTLEQDDWNVVRDEDGLLPGDLISAFMTRLGQADRVIVVLSDKYLRSIYCMTELHSIYQRSVGGQDDFQSRVVPLALDDVRIYRWEDRVDYVKFWAGECERMEPDLPILGPTSRELFNRIREWQIQIDEMLCFLSNKIRLRGFDDIVKDNFAALRKMLSQPSAPVLDAAKKSEFAQKSHEHTSEATEPAGSTIQEVVLLIHGIRDFGEWEQMVSNILEEIPGTRVPPLNYGRFDALRFWLPFGTRDDPVKKLLPRIRDARIKFPKAKLSVIAHSFGTYAIGKILKDNPDIRLHRLILCGAILPTEFRWDQIPHSVETEILNDCGIRDIWPVLAQSTTFGYGPSGRFGFGTLAVRDRFHDFGHGGFFQEKFVSDFWLPWFRSGNFVKSKAPPPSGTRWHLITIIQIKWLVLFCAFLILVSFAFRSAHPTPTPTLTPTPAPTPTPTAYNHL